MRPVQQQILGRRLNYGDGHYGLDVLAGDEVVVNTIAELARADTSGSGFTR